MKNLRITWLSGRWLAVGLLAFLAQGVNAAEYRAVDLSAFRDGAQHWQAKFGRDRSDERLAPGRITEIADNCLAYQLPDGGWPKNLDPQALVPRAVMRRLRGRSLDRSSLDNRSTYPQVEYLARVYQVTKTPRYRTGAERGLDYILSAQNASGGWRGADVDAITFNDDVMVGVMGLLQRIVHRDPHLTWIDESRRRRAAVALERGIAATLKCQIIIDGKRTAWCQQHSHDTFLPVKARSYELPAICPVESAAIVNLLMNIEQPDETTITAIEAAVSWIDDVKLTGIRVVEVEIPPVRFDNHTAKFDRRVVADESARPIWARYYDLETNRPFFCDRDGVKVQTLAEVHHERRTGYGWYSSAPLRLLEREYPAWRTRRGDQKLAQ